MKIIIYYSPHTLVGALTPSPDEYNIIMFEVQPYRSDPAFCPTSFPLTFSSIDYGKSMSQYQSTCKKGNAPELDVSQARDKRKIMYTYSVEWVPTTVKYQDRWRTLLFLEALLQS